MSGGLTRRTRAILLAGVVAQAVLLCMAHLPQARVLRGDERMYWHLALGISHAEWPAPNFIWPPLHSYLMGASLALFGVHRLPFELLQSGLFIVSGLFLRRLILMAGFGALAADGALALFLLDPQLASFAQYFWPEVPHLFLILGALVLLFSGQRGRMFWSGVCIGLALLEKSIFMPFVPAFLAAAAFVSPELGWVARLGRALVLAAGVLLVIGPVVLVNGTRYGVWSVANSGPLNLWVGLNDPASRTDYDSVDAPAVREYRSLPVESRNPIMWSRISDKIHQEGAATILVHQLRKQYARLFDRNSFFTDQLAGGRWEPTLAPDARTQLGRLWAYLLYAVTLVLAAFGLFRFRAARDQWRLAIPLAVIGYHLVTFLFLHCKTRYRVPLLPALIVLAALALDDPPRLDQRPRLIGGGLLALGLLPLAFPL